MTSESITYLVGACCGVFALAAFIGFIVVPAWQSYAKAWERVAATFLTLYVLAALLVVGVAGGAVVAYYWDRVSG